MPWEAELVGPSPDKVLRVANSDQSKVSADVTQSGTAPVEVSAEVLLDVAHLCSVLKGSKLTKVTFTGP